MGLCHERGAIDFDCTGEKCVTDTAKVNAGKERERKRACAKRTIRKRRRINQGIPCHRRRCRTSISVRAECVAYKIETGRERPFKIKEATDKIPLGVRESKIKKHNSPCALIAMWITRERRRKKANKNPPSRLALSYRLAPDPSSVSNPSPLPHQPNKK